MMASSNGSIFCLTDHLWGGSTGHRWIPLTKASDAELWCFFYLYLNKRLNKQSRRWWFETSPHSLWRHCHGIMACPCLTPRQYLNQCWRIVHWRLRKTVPWYSYDWRLLLIQISYDNVIKWKHFLRYWHIVRGIHRSPVNSPHKDQWRGALMFSVRDQTVE